MTIAQRSVAFFFQAAIILAAARLAGSAAQRWLMQPRVVGEMIAGVMLGPTLLGALAPSLHAAVFPEESRPVLFVFAQAGAAAVSLVVLAVSIIAKGGASYAAARLVGQDQRSALGIGALMNARGLMELIVIAIGLQRGIITPALFSILVAMAVVTTLMASPLFELSRRLRE